MAKKTKLFEGKTKVVYEAPENDNVLLEFKDDIGTEKKGKIKGKGAVNAQISQFLLKYLEGYHVPTHHVDQQNDHTLIVKKAEPIRIEVVLRNIAFGDLCDRCGFEDGAELSTPVMEYYLKDDALKRPLINEYHVYALKMATQQELLQISKLALKINAVMKSFFQRRNMLLVEFKFEFGRYDNGIMLIDELSPDTFIVWDNSKKEKPDRNKYNIRTGKPEDAMKELKSKLIS